MVSLALPALAVLMEPKGRKVPLDQLGLLVPKAIKETQAPKARLDLLALIQRWQALRGRPEPD